MVAYPLLLVAITLMTFHGGATHSFTNWDDWKYIVENPLVHGISFDKVWVSFTRFHVFNYNPLHLISYMLDYELWGLNGGGFFVTGLVLHLGAGLLIHAFACKWLGFRALAFVVAAIFLCHPTRIESVGWLSERKDVLSAFFAGAALLLHLRTLTPLDPRKGWAVQAGVFFFYLLALLSKSQLVTLPCVLVALDLWAGRPLGRSLLFKLPHFTLSAIFSVLTLSAHTNEGMKGIQFPDSILVPLAALPRYVAHAVWPTRLSPYYDFVGESFASTPMVLAGAALFLAMVVGVWISYQGKRVWLLGIVWFLALLAPVSGLVRINIFLADRYLYLALVGPLLALASTALTWGVARLASLLGVISVVACAMASANYLPVFRDSESLWVRVLEICPGASIAHSNYGAYLRQNERWAESAVHYDADLAEKPYFEESFLGRAYLHDLAGEYPQAAALYERLLEKKPQSMLGRIEYADFLHRRGELQKALGVLSAQDLSLADAIYYCKLCDVLLALDRKEEARAAFQFAARIDGREPRVIQRQRLFASPW